MKSKRTWVLIADAGRARVLERESDTRKLVPVEGLSFENELPPVHDLVDDRQARSFESVGNMRHPVSGPTDPRRKEKRRFVDELASLLDQKLAGGAFDALILVAPPQALGDFRAAISNDVRKAIVSEIAKDLTKTPDHEVAEHLS